MFQAVFPVYLNILSTLQVYEGTKSKPVINDQCPTVIQQRMKVKVNRKRISPEVQSHTNTI